MRLLKRHTDTDDHLDTDDDPGEGRTVVAPDQPAVVPEADRVPPDHAGPAVPDGRTMDAPGAAPVAPPDRDVPVERVPVDRDRDAYAEPTVRTERVDPATVPVDAVPERVETEDVVIRRWSWADATVALIGAGMALVGIIALVRAGVDSSWFRPEVQVIEASHTALLGALEVGAGVLLVLAALGRARILATLLGLAIAVAGAFAAIETGEVSRELAIEDWWAWTLAGTGILVVLLAVVPRRGRVERVVRTA